MLNQKNLKILFLSSFMIFFSLKAQRNIGKINLVDSLRIYTNNRNGGFRLGFDNRNSYIGGKSASVQGLRFGLNYKKVALYSGVYTSLSTSINTNAKDTQVVGFDYFATTLEYYLADNWRYDIYIPILIGYGQSYTTIKNAGTNTYTNKFKALVPIELGIGGTVRFLRYFGVAGSTGYRFSVLNNNGYAAPFWSIGLTFYTGTIWKDFKKAIN